MKGVNDIELYKAIEGKISNFGVPALRIGYKYIVEAVYYILNNRGIISITKEVYPYIADLFGTTSKAVERAMRTAISCGCKENNKFPMYSFDGITYVHFTNKEFIIKTVNAVKSGKEIVNNDEY